MKSTPVTDHITQLTRLRFMNAFLVREDDGLTLVDTTIAGSSAAIIRAAAALDLPIRRIILTHAHGDHVGSLDALHERLPDADVLVSARDARFLRGDKSLDPHEAATKLRGGYPVIKTTPTGDLVDQAMIGSLRVIASPGHTPGHMALLDIRTNTLIAGDAFSSLIRLVPSDTRASFFLPLPAIATWNPGLARTSAQRLAAIEPDTLVVGHGPVVRDATGKMKAALAR